MNTIKGLNYLFFAGTTTEDFSTIDTQAISDALGLSVTKLETDNKKYPYQYLIHTPSDNKNGVIIAVNANKNSCDIFSYANGVIGSYASGRSCNHSKLNPAVLFYKKDAEKVVFGISQIQDPPVLIAGYVPYRKLGETEQHKGFILGYPSASINGGLIAEEGNSTEFSSISTYSAENILALVPAISIQEGCILDNCFFSYISANTVNTFYAVAGGKVYVSFRRYITNGRTFVIQFDS